MSLPLADPPADFDRLLDDFQRRLRVGEGPTAETYAARFPHLADRIREVFPVVAALEQVATPPPPTQPGRLGDYRIVREVGRGGMGVVYEAVQESLGRRVAVKVFPAAHLSRPGLRERFAREAQAAGRLHHTNIVPVFGVGDEGGVPFFAMQFISGCGLDRVIAAVRTARGPAERTPTGTTDMTTPVLLAVSRPSPAVPAVLTGQTGPAYFRTAARLMLEAADALAHAHAHGVQHRDVKPANLLVDDAGVLWVTDFGLAKVDDGANLTATGDHLGTLRYAPPERFRGAADHRADVYSLGATFYELLALHPAFPDADPLALIDRIKGDPPPPPRAVNPAVPADLNTVCLKCLEKEPAKRYQSAADLVADLRAFLDGRPISARRVGPIEAVVKWVRRKPVTATVLAALTLMVAGVVAAAVVRERERRADHAAAQVMTLRRAATPELPPVLANLHKDFDRVRPELTALAERPIGERAALHARLALLGDDPRYAEEVADYLLVCPVEQLLPVRQIAGPHLGPHRDRFWAVLRDPRADGPARVRAAGVMAGQAPEDPCWAEVSRPLVDLLVNIDPVELGPLARAVGPALPRLADALEARYEQDQRELAAAGDAPADLAARVGRMNAAAVLLWQTLGERSDVAVWLAGAAEDAHLSAPLATIRRKREVIEPLLRAALNNPTVDQEAARRRAGVAAVLLAGAGPDDPLWELFRHTPDPTVRSHLIRRCAPAGVAPDALARRFAAETDVSAKRALLLALGEYPADRLPAGFLASVCDLYRHDPDPGLHSAAGWALRHRWAEGAAADERDAEAAKAGRAGRGWFVAPHGITYAVVTPTPPRVRIGTPGHTADMRLSDEVPCEVDVRRTLAVGCTEVTTDLLRRWPDCPPDIEDGTAAAGGVSWFVACQFCDWLSVQEGLEPCYQPATGSRYEVGMRPAPFHVLRTGWRLPTEAEWEYAARAGGDGPRFFGRADGLLTRYAWTVANARDHPQPVGRLRPNDFGLFDVLGNVQEWTDDRYRKVYLPGPRPDFGLVARVRDGDNHVLRGGAFNLAENRVRSAYRYNIIPANGPGSCGFRMVRTLP